MIATSTLRDELKREHGVEVCRIVSRRVALEFTRIIPEPKGDDEGSMITELYEGDVVLIVRARDPRGGEERGASSR